MALNGMELESAIIALVNNPEGVLIPLNMFESRIPKGNPKVIIKWFIERGLLEEIVVPKCGTVENSIVVAWMPKGVAMKKAHTDGIRIGLALLNGEV